MLAIRCHGQCGWFRHGEDGPASETLKRKREAEAKAVPAEQLIDFTNMSKRQRRKAIEDAKKQNARTANKVDLSGLQASGAAAPTAETVTDQADTSKIVVESKVDLEALVASAHEWPFQLRCDELVVHDLFHPQWERRHGAAVGLKAIINTHGAGAGKNTKAAATAQTALNAVWLEDMALRLLCVCALDRFGDFGSDQVIAPVRNTCAQALGTVVKHMDTAAVTSVLGVLLLLQGNEHWEVRHGGLLGVKYLVAVRADLVETMLDSLLPVIIAGLGDSDDDVRGAASEALLPISVDVIQLRPRGVPALLSILWDALLDLDDLTVSTGSVLELLADLTASTRFAELGGKPLSTLVPRLFPFFRHTLTGVRKAVLRTLRILVAAAGASDWLGQHLPAMLRLTYQNLLVEENATVLAETEVLWRAALAAVPGADLFGVINAHIGRWMGLLVTPSGVVLSETDMLAIKHATAHDDAAGPEHAGTDDAKPAKRRKTVKYMEDKASARAKKSAPPAKPLVGGANQETAPNEDVVLAARHRASKAIGTAVAQCEQNGFPVDNPVQGVLELMKPNSATRRYCGAVLVRDWANGRPAGAAAFPPAVIARLMAMLTDATVSDVSYIELDGKVLEMRSQVVRVLQIYSKCGTSTTEISAQGQPGQFGVNTALQLANETCARWDADLVNRGGNKGLAVRQDRRAELRNVIEALQQQWIGNKRMIQGASAAAIVATNVLPAAITPIIKPLMDSIKKEKQAMTQQLCGEALSRVLLLARTREKCPNGKIVKNLASILCKDREITPLSSAPGSTAAGAMISLDRLKIEPLDKPKGKVTAVAPTAAGVTGSALLAGTDDALSEERLCYRGASETFKAMAKLLGKSLPEMLPAVFNNLVQMLSPLATSSAQLSQEAADTIIGGLQLLETLVPWLDEGLLQALLPYLPVVLNALQNDEAAVRFKASTCLAACASWATGSVPVMQTVADVLLPRLGDSTSATNRKGAAEAIYHLVTRLEMKVIPYIVILVIPMLGRMSDFDSNVREVVSRTFAILMTLMPLESGVPNPVGMSEALVAQKQRDRRFLDQLLDSSKLEHYTLPTRITATLRSYQQDGLNWMKFLDTYQLHGVLCDDMGLGKTLQSICMVVGSHTDRAASYAATGAVDMAHLPSIVVCPTTLVVHWGDEFNKWCPDFRPLKYMGGVKHRKGLRSQIAHHDVVILSYEALRSEADYFSARRFNYAILDEGHIIKNPKSKITLAVKSVQCKHRVLLSGTPIQNNVLELWSIFDFLMPGFLGTEKQFNQQYSKPITKMRDAKAKSKEQEAGTLALERLHRQVLPFLLRRMKEDVLSDLPPKIIQDYTCNLSQLQRQLYGAFAKTQLKSGIEQGAADKKPSGHIFQALQYLRKVCNHPQFVLSKAHPWWQQIVTDLRKSGSQLDDMEHSGKLVALKQLLQDCGLGPQKDSGSEAVESAVGQHRCLIFAQSKKMLEMIIKNVLQSASARVPSPRSLPALHILHLLHSPALFSPSCWLYRRCLLTLMGHRSSLVPGRALADCDVHASRRQRAGGQTPVGGEHVQQ